MSNETVCATLQLTLLLTAALALRTAQALPATHASPLLGEWEFAVPGVKCVEWERYDANGDHLVHSGQEISRSKFKISSTPTAAGFFKLEDKVVEDNGKPDCSGSVTPVGDSVTLYVIFLDENSYALCYHESQDDCFGIGRRKQLLETVSLKYWHKG